MRVKCSKELIYGKRTETINSESVINSAEMYKKKI